MDKLRVIHPTTGTEVVQALLEADFLGRHLNQVFKQQHHRYRRVD